MQRSAFGCSAVFFGNITPFFYIKALCSKKESRTPFGVRLYL